MKKSGILIFVLSLVLITVPAAIVVCVHGMLEREGTLYISHESGIYDESILLTVSLFGPGVIYYTANGEKPELGEAGALPQNAMIYEEPLLLELSEETTTYSFQFICMFEDGTFSEVYKRDYILDSKGRNRFSTTYIVSITGDEEKLFGYEEGIFVRGRQFDEYMAENPDVNPFGTNIPANYFSDVELPVNAAIFLQDGTWIINQNCGIKLFGNMTRAKNQKSFRLIARYDYDYANEFAYAFLPKLISEQGHTAVDAFQRLSFHNSGNDNGYAFIRTELIGELARKSGFSDVMVSESATVYVNGKYQGVYWLTNAYDDRYFKEKYGDYEGEMVVCEGELSYMLSENAETENEKQYMNDYNGFCAWVRTADMADDDNWNHVCEVIDIRNFALYMAIEYYVGNVDWPSNNVKVYRYKAARDEDYYEGTVFDGKYRYLLFDTDYGMGLKFLGWYGYDETEKRLENLCKYLPETFMFRHLLQREEFRLLFINSILHLMNEGFSFTSVSAVLDEYNAKRYQELKYMMEETDILKNSIWESDDNNIENVDEELTKILTYAKQRPITVMEEMQEMWNCGERVELSVSSAMAGCVFVSGLEAEGSNYDCFCLENVPVEIMFIGGAGITVTGYHINSIFMEGEKIAFMPGEWAGADGRILIEPVFETEPVECLVISAYHIRGEEDYVILKNNGQVPLLLSDYALADSEEKWSRGRLPDVELEPGEEYVVYGEKYAGERAPDSTSVPFSWSRDEKILLIHMSEGIVDSKNEGLKK